MNSNDFLAFIREDFPLTPAQEAAFEALDALYREWNAQINVISRKDIDNLYEHHVLHSLAILFPSARFVLCDSVGKKTIVAQAVSSALGLENVQVVNARAESLPQTFDFVVSRAVASLTDFYPWVKGKFSRGILYLKGGDVVPEIAEVMARHRMARGSVHTWPVSSWLAGPYYDGKLVIHIEK